MKKLILAAAAILSSAVIFAKTWTNNVGFGIKLPSQETVKSNDSNSITELRDFTSLVIGLDVQYVGFHEKGLAVKDNFTMSFGGFQGDNTDQSLYENNINFNCTDRVGVGYGIIRSEKLFLGVFGVLGVDVNAATYSKNDYKDTMTTLGLLAGADVTAIFNFTQKFGMYASLAITGDFARFYEKSEDSSKSSTVTTTSDWNLKPSCVILPSIGVTWRF